MSTWAGLKSGLATLVEEQTARCLATYREDPSRVEQDAAIETSTAEGGYGRKQLYELVQNGADAMLGASGRIHVVLTENCLYVANEGHPMTEAGVQSLMASHISRKRGDEIGRFGLGFKSVVSISDGPQILSRSGSFTFDRASSVARIREVVPNAPAYPMLRVASPLDPAQVSKSDEVARELMSWASTVIRLPLTGDHRHLQDDVQQFPAEFLLFSPHAAELRLEDRTSIVARTVRLKAKRDGSLALDDDGKISNWRVAFRKHRPSHAALKDAGERAHREAITVWWAAPMESRSATGRFWAFFPTEDQTTLGGIINAPWKTGDDRRNLLEGEFNREILTTVLPALVASEWKNLVDPKDPASVLDLAPARGREARSWADDVVNQPVMSALQLTRSLPDLSGKLQLPSTLRLHPPKLEGELLQLWRTIEPAKTRWVSHGVEQDAARRAKAERLIGESEASRPNLRAWIEAILDDSVPTSATAILLVAAIASMRPDLKAEAKTARVVLLEDGVFAPAVAGQVFVRSSPTDTGFNFIDPDLARLPAVSAALAELGVRVLDPAGALRNYLSSSRLSELDWAMVWSMVRRCTAEIALRVLRDELQDPLETKVRVRTRKGEFVPVGMAYLPGRLVSASDPGDIEVCIDTQFHQDELTLLGDLGCVAQPTLRHDPPREPWLFKYEDMVKGRYVEKASGAKPQLDRLVVKGAEPPWPLQPITKLRAEGRRRLTEVVLGLTTGDPWTVRHQTNTMYGVTKFMNPVHHLLMQHGALSTSFGPLPVDLCLRPHAEHPDDVLPVADVSEATAEALRLKAEPRDLTPEGWADLLSLALRWDDVRRASRFYAWAVHFANRPDQMLAQLGRQATRVATREVAVVTRQETFHALSEQAIPVILVEDVADAARLVDEWELEDGARLLEQELVFQPSGEPETLVDLYPKLRLYLGPELHDVQLQMCESIDLITATRDGMKGKPVRRALDGKLVLVTDDSPESSLRAVSDLFQLDLTASDIREIIENVREQETEKLLAEVRNAVSDDDRLALLVGAERLRRSVPEAALADIEDTAGSSLDAVALARLARSVHGVGILQYFRSVLDDHGLNPPVHWAGGSAVRKFVMDLGFPAELAGFASQPRPAMTTVEGPAVLDPLHDYQNFVTVNIRRLLRSEASGRGMVSLPTGAGKTRIAVQALVEEVREGALAGPVVWIAQSEELCEQAVESWSYIWRAVGPHSPLSIGRLWGSSNEVDEEPGSFQLVIATPEKLKLRLGTERYAWLSEPAVVVIDEAHRSISPTYTDVLEKMGRGSRGERRKATRPLIGLTATPFRNTNVEETKRLVNRYDGIRLDDGAFIGDPYLELQRRQVLARVNHQMLAGANISFTQRELQEIRDMRMVPSSIETKLGADTSRNRRIVDSIAGLPADWTVLLFATSVDNARVLAALLVHQGIPAVAISSDTDSNARRHYIEEFQAGRIRVITNYQVLTQGFDAPKVKAVYVTRPTFAPNVYQQMIGRGLRGPKNGGFEEVLIVNVEDNFHQYGDILAFREFEYLWNPDAE